MKFMPLFDLRVRHSFYTDGRCPDFTIEPSATTEALLRNHRSHLKHRQDGVSVLCAVDGDGKTFIRFPEGTSFGFHLRLRNADLPLFTDLVPVRQLPAPLYSNDGLGSGDGPGLRLISREAWSSETFAVVEPGRSERFVFGGKPLHGSGVSDFAVESATPIQGVTAYDGSARSILVDSRGANRGDPFTVTYPTRPRLARGVFAAVEIRANDTLPQIHRPTEAPREFQIDIGAKLARWSYYCVTDLKANSEEFEIADTSSSGATPGLAFSKENRTDLNQTADPSDEVASALAERYPDLQRYRFVSDGQIACRQAARKNLEFRLNGNRLIGSLPNPSIRNFATMRVQVDGTLQKQDSLFQVVRFLAQSHP